MNVAAELVIMASVKIELSTSIPLSWPSDQNPSHTIKMFNEHQNKHTLHLYKINSFDGTAYQDTVIHVNIDLLGC